MDRFSAAAQLALGLPSAAAGMIAFIYACLFYAGWPLEYLSIDAVASPWRHPSLLSSIPLLNNTVLLLIFCFSHSLLARKWCKDLFHAVPPSIYRYFYLIVTALSVFLICYGWSPQPRPVWHVEWTPARYLFCFVGMLGLLLNGIALKTLQPLMLYGLKEPLEKLLRTSIKGGHLVTSGVYAYVRHPMYTGLVIAMWSHPTMSEGRLFLCVALLLYLLVALPYLEEPDLIKLFGQSYKDYMQKTPMLFPLPPFPHPKSQ